jgi:hypothetical protein
MGSLRTSALAASLLIASVSPTLANLVTDPGFESCPSDLSPPTGLEHNERNLLRWGRALGKLGGGVYLPADAVTNHPDNRWRHL